MSMSLQQLVRPWIADAIVHQPLADPMIDTLTLDSRKAQPGCAFVALAGARTHGYAHAAQAIGLGASAILLDPDGLGPSRIDGPAAQIEIPALRAKLGSLAARFYGVLAQQIGVVGVTGTNGKTSIVQLLAQALTRLGAAVGTQGTLGSGLYPALESGERTTPDALATQAFLARMQRAGAQYVAMEVSSHALDQQRVAGTAFKVAVLSNLSRDHLDYHGSMVAYAEAKAKLFDWPDLAAAVINQDDAFGSRLLDQRLLAERLLAERVCAPRLIGYGLDSTCEVRASALRYTPQGLQFELHFGREHFAVQSELLGRFNVYNLLAVASSLLALGYATHAIADVIAQLKPIHGRMNRLGGCQQSDHQALINQAPTNQALKAQAAKAQALIVVDYAHTPDGLQQALTAVRAHAPGRLTVVFGCGGDRDRGKRPEMGAIAARLADCCIVTDDNPRTEPRQNITDDILAGMHGHTVLVQHDRAQAIKLAIAQSRPGDVVLIAGKGHETYQEIGTQLLPFDDTQVASQALQEAVL